MENRETKEMQVIESEASASELEDALEIIERRNALFQRVMQVAIQTTSPGDWVDQDGKPYLQGSGAEKVARRFAVRVYDVNHDLENHTDDRGPYYMYITTGKVGLGTGKESIEAIGTCSSRDNLFSHGGKKDLKDVDRGNIMKKSYTNFLVNGITRLLGIRNLTWDELAKYGISKNGKASVQYKGASEKAAATKTAEKAEKESSKPFWTSEYNGKLYIHAREGEHFGAEYLQNMGFKASKKAGNWNTMHTPDIEAALNDEYIAAEAEMRAIEAAEEGAS